MKQPIYQDARDRIASRGVPTKPIPQRKVAPPKKQTYIVDIQDGDQAYEVEWTGVKPPTREEVAQVLGNTRRDLGIIGGKYQDKPAGAPVPQPSAQPVKQTQPGMLDYLQNLLPTAVQPVAQAVRGNALGGASIAAKESLNSAAALDQMVSPQLAKARQVVGNTVANIIQPFGVTDEQKFIRKGISKGIQASDPTQMLGMASAGKAAMEAKPSKGGGNIGMEIAKFLADPARNTIKMLAGIDDELLRKAVAGDAEAMADLVGRGAAFVIQSGVGAKAVGAFKSGKSAKAALNALQDAEKAVSNSDALAQGLRGINAEKPVLKTPIAQFDLPAPRANAPDMPTNPQNVNIPRYDNGNARTLKSRDFSLHPSERGDRFHMEPSGVIFDRLYATSITPPAASGKPWVRELLERLNKSDYNFKDNRPPGTLWKGDTVDIGLTRREMVEQALSEGKPVPAEVLADYPDLGKNKLGRQRSPLEASQPTGSENKPTVDVGHTPTAGVVSNAGVAKPGTQAGTEAGRSGHISPNLSETARADATPPDLSNPANPQNVSASGVAPPLYNEGNTAPTGWYAHGRRNPKQFGKTGHVILGTIHGQKAEAYTSQAVNDKWRSGLFLIKPNDHAVPLNLDDVRSAIAGGKKLPKDITDAIAIMKGDAERYGETINEQSIVDEIMRGFEPDDIVDSGQWYDIPSVAKWLRSTFKADYAAGGDWIAVLDPKARNMHVWNYGDGKMVNTSALNVTPPSKANPAPRANAPDMPTNPQNVGTSPVGEAVGATFRPNTHMGEVTAGHRAAVEATGKPLTTNETANADFQATIDQLTKQKESDRMKGAARFLSDPTPDHELLDPFSDIYDQRLDHAIQRAFGEPNPTDGGGSKLLAKRLQNQELEAAQTGDFMGIQKELRDELKLESKTAEGTGYVRWYRDSKSGIWRAHPSQVLGLRMNELSPQARSAILEAIDTWGGNDSVRFVPEGESRNLLQTTKKHGGARVASAPHGGLTLDEFIRKEGNEADGKGTFVPMEVVRKVIGDNSLDQSDINLIARELGMTDEAAVKTIKDIAAPEVRSDLTTSMASTAEVREKLGYVARDVEPQKIEQWVKDAELRKGQESGIADQLKEKPRQLSPAEEIALGRAMQKAIEARDAAIKSGDTLAYDLADAEAMKMAEALETSGSEWGRQGVARQVIIADDFSEFGIRRKWAKAADRDLTGAETKQAQSLSKDLEEARAELQRLTNVNTGLEEYILAKGKEGPKGSAVAKRADIAARRSEAINSLVNKWKESAPEPSMRSDAFGAMAAIETAQRFAAVAPDILKIAKTYVDEGIVAIEEVIAKVRTHIPDEMGMSDDELRAILAGKVKAKAEAETVKSDWESLKESASRHFQNAREEIRRESATAKAEKRAADKTAAAELRKAEAAFWKDVRTREAAFQKGVKAKAATERAEYRKWWAKSSGGRTASLMDQANRLTAKIEAMDKGTWQAAGKQLADPTVVEAQVKVDALKRLVRMKESELVPQKVGPIGQVAGAARTSLTMGDFSAPLTQGALAGMLNPKSWFKSFGKSIGSTFKSEASYNQAVAKLMQDPNFDTILASNIDLPAIKKGADGEFFFDTFLDKTPVVGAVKRGSQQGYDMYLTDQRVSLMSSYLDTIKATGRPLDKDGIKMIGEAVSVLTGKGAGQTAAGLAKADLGRALFAPSWWLSQYQAVTGRPLRHALSYGKSTGNWAPARLMAKEYAKLTAGTLGILYGVEEALTVAKSDWRVERDPRSSLFGKMYKYTDGRLVSVDLLPMQISGPLKQIFQLAPMIGAVLDKDNKASSDSYERSRVAGQTLFGKQAPLSKNLYEMGDSWDTTNAISDGKDKKYPFDKNKDPRSAEGAKNLALGQIPISWQQLGETMGAPLNGLEKTLLGVSSLGGRGANSYKSDPIKRDPRKSLIFNRN